MNLIKKGVLLIFLSRPYINNQEVKSVKEVLLSGWISSGSKVREFEQRFAKFIGTKYAVSLNSCASALQLAIQAQGLKGEVILPSFTFVASVNAIINAGCIPRFADIEYSTCTIDAQKIEKLVNRKTVAIMPVHYAGQSCDMDKIMALSKKYNLAVIEDSAEAIGASFKRKKTGSFGVGCFSFFATKNMACGEGGMVTTSDKIIRDRIAAYSSHGILKYDNLAKKNPWHKEAAYFGYNQRMSNIVAAIGVVQLNKLEAMNKKRRERVRYLNERLRQFREIEIPVERPGCYHVYQMYTVKFNSNILSRDKFVYRLRKRGIEASVHFYPPLHNQALCKKYRKTKDELPVTEKVCKKIVTLPLYPHILKKDLDYVVANIKEILGKPATVRRPD